jgi:hypothetical protein
LEGSAITLPATTACAATAFCLEADAMKRLLPPVLCLLLLAGCGPILGQMMKASEGLKSFEIKQGDLAALGEGRDLVVFGPFTKTDQAFYIARGEDAANFAQGLRNSGLFRTELYVERQYDKAEELASRLRASTPAQIKTALGLKEAPEFVLFGTILHRSTIVAPTRGVVTDVGYRLEFWDVKAGTSVVLEASVKELFEDCVPRIVGEIARRVRGGKRGLKAG